MGARALTVGNDKGGCYWICAYCKHKNYYVVGGLPSECSCENCHDEPLGFNNLTIKERIIVNEANSFYTPAIIRTSPLQVRVLMEDLTSIIQRLDKELTEVQEERNSYKTEVETIDW